jgi:chemotaxis signal transduction protein
MSINSPVRSRRTAGRNTEKTKQFISFLLRQEWFVLPIEAVQRVIQMGKVYGDPQGTGVSLTNFQGQEIVVVDVGYLIFGDSEKKLSVASEKNQPRILLILQSSKDEIVGLPVDSTPIMRRVPDSAFTPIPETYIAQGNVRCISSTMIQLSDHPPMFLLDPSQLIEPQKLSIL